MLLTMDEDKVINNETMPNARQQLENLLAEIIPEEQRTGNVEQDALTYIRGQKEMNDKMVEALSENPEFAQAMNDVVNKRSNGQAALARYFGKDFLSLEEGTPEYDEMIKADDEWRSERDAARKAAEEFDKAMEKSQEEINAHCAAKGIDPETYQERIENEFILPIFSGNINEALLAKLDKAMDYDKDTEDAFVAGEIKGRNENINKLRVQPTDGLPKGLGSQTVINDRPKVRRNRLIEDALNA